MPLSSYATSSLVPIAGDSSTRRYYRILRNGQSFILMESAPDGSPEAIPGHSLRDFIRIGTWLRSIGLRAPEIYETDENSGHILMEDFGDVSLKRALDQGMPPAETYATAVDILVSLREASCDLDLPGYYQSHVHQGRRRIVDWYLPVARRQRNPDGLVEDYLAVWDEIESGLPPCPQGFLHIDYHVENLMWLPDGCGILDFQGAMTGPLPYDLANLLEDARIDVLPDVRRAMLDRYCAGMSPADKENFEAWYRVLATQFHCRVVGQFIKLAFRHDKPRYLQYLPRLNRYLSQALEDPLLAPLKYWFEKERVTFDLSSVSGEEKFIRPDAF